MKSIKLTQLVLVVVAAFLFNGEVIAQQDAKYRQFTFNKLVFNPAVTGDAGSPYIMATYREQWMGLEGAPSTFNIQAHSPIKNKRIALGLQIINDQVGIRGFTGIYSSYAYRVPFSKGKLSLGIDAGAVHHRTIFSEALIEQLSDPTVTAATYSGWVPNVSVGVYYSTYRFYVGFSAKDLIENGLSVVDNPLQPDQDYSYENTHFFGMTGFRFNLAEKVIFDPALLLTFVDTDDYSAEVNGGLEFNSRLWIGGGYNYEKSAYGGARLHMTEKMALGYVYEFPLTNVASFVAASHEIMLSMELGSDRNKRIHNPRFR